MDESDLRRPKAGRVDVWPFGWVIIIFDLFEELNWKLSWILLSSVLFEKMTPEGMCYAARGPSNWSGLYNFNLSIEGLMFALICNVWFEKAELAVPILLLRFMKVRFGGLLVPQRREDKLKRYPHGVFFFFKGSWREDWWSCVSGRQFLCYWEMA